MKFLIVSALTVLAVCVSGDPEILMKVMQDCKISMGATDEELGQMMAHTPPFNTKQKCTFNCIMESVGVVSY